MLALLHLLGICLPSLWGLLFPLPLISPSPAKVRLSLTLTLSLLRIWCFGQTLPFLFLLTKAALAYLSTAHFAAGPVCSSFCLEACAILQALCWSWQHQPVGHFFSYASIRLSPPCLLFHLSFYLKLSSLSSFTIRPQWVPRHSFLLGNNAADELARRGALLVPSATPCSLSYPLFSDWRRAVSSINSSTRRFLRSPPRNLCSSSRSLCSLSTMRQPKQPTVKLFISLGLAESRILLAAPVDTSHLILHCPATDSAPLTLCHSLRPLIQAPELSGFWDSMVFRHAPIPQKGSGSNNSGA